MQEPQYDQVAANGEIDEKGQYPQQMQQQQNQQPVTMEIDEPISVLDREY